MSRERTKFNQDGSGVKEWNPSTDRTVISREEFCQIKSVKAYSRLMFHGCENDFSVALTKQNDGSVKAKVHTRMSELLYGDNSLEYNLSPKQFSRLVDKLYDSSFLEWLRNDYDPVVLDGYNWGISVKLDSGRSIKKQGSNRRPKDLDKVFSIITMWMPNTKPEMDSGLKALMDSVDRGFNQEEADRINTDLYSKKESENENSDT